MYIFSYRAEIIKISNRSHIEKNFNVETLKLTIKRIWSKISGTWIGMWKEVNRKSSARSVYRLKRHEYTIHVECRCEDRSCQKELGLSSLQRIAAVGLDATSQPLARTCTCTCTYVCVRAHTTGWIYQRERGRGSRVARVTYCRARFTRDALDKFLVPFELSDSSRSRTIRVIIPLLSSVSNRENFVQNVNRSLNILFYFRGNFRRVRFEWIGINFSEDFNSFPWFDLGPSTRRRVTNISCLIVARGGLETRAL